MNPFPSKSRPIPVNPQALAVARQLDEERRVKGTRVPMHGIPVLLKDNGYACAYEQATGHHRAPALFPADRGAAAGLARRLAR